MKRKLIPVAILLLFTAAVTKGQQSDLSGTRIFINPGHGGYDSDDRHMIATDFWESEGNLIKGLSLRTLLVNLNATVFMSRTTNNTSDDLPLSAIATMANSANADFFLSIHSNGYDGTQNQPLMLYRGYDDQPVYPASKTMALILWQKIFEKGNCWTRENVWVKGDWSFYPEWGDKVGLGVLRTLTMPGVLSEGSFHDYIPEGWRLRNNDFLLHESWALVRSFIEFENVTPLQHGIIAGILRDSLESPSWYFKPGTNDASMPLDNATVTLMPGNRKYFADDLNNGFFFFDSIPPGDYRLYFEGVPDFMDDSTDVKVTANKSTLVDFKMQFDTTIVPRLTDLVPSLVDSVAFNQEFVFSFSLPMDRDSVQKALIYSPLADFTFEWDDDSKVLSVRPAVSLNVKTLYTIRLTTSACSKWKVKISGEEQFSFVTRSRTKLNLERNFPRDATTGVSLYPQVRLWFDAPLEQSTAPGEIQMLDDQGTPLAKLREEFHESDGKGGYFFELSQPLSLGRQYTVRLNSTLKDITGTTFGTGRDIKFTTRTTAYETGSVVESFDDISVFWDPEASGSTTGTDNPLTTFKASPLIKMAGTNAGRLDYVFTNPAGGVCRVFDTRKPVIGQNATSKFGIWVFGDMSMNILEYWFYSAGTANQIVFADTIDWAGWDLKMIPFTSIGGTGDRQYHSVVVRQTAPGVRRGTLWFDDAMTFTPTGIDNPSETDVSLAVFPNPVTSEGTVTFNLSGRSLVTIDVYSSEGRKVEQIINAPMEPGLKSLRWLPSATLPDGVYLLRLEVKGNPGASSAPTVIRCILAR